MNKKLVRKLCRQYRKGEKLRKGVIPGSALHHRMTHRLTRLDTIIQELKEEE